jgi:hypothetical protein
MVVPDTGQDSTNSPPDSAQKDLHKEAHPTLLSWGLEVLYLTLLKPSLSDSAQKGLHQEAHPTFLPWVPY